MNANIPSGLENSTVGKLAVVTGASSGIGQAIALELARAGATLLLHGNRNLAGLQATRAKVAALGASAEVVQFNLAELAAHDLLVQSAADWAARQGKPLSIWVNNAGADVLTGDVAGWSFEQKLELLWQVDVTATLRLTRLAGRLMQASGGAIVNIGWDQAEVGMAGDSGELFAATKGAIMAFTRSAAHSLAPQVRVNCVAPGWIKTKWGDKASDYWQQRAQIESLLNRWGTPEDVAQAVHFLASPASGFITGHVLPVNGGLR
jgi:3-oxoacyl-[acyl-carrier protein] reductase